MEVGGGVKPLRAAVRGRGAELVGLDQDADQGSLYVDDLDTWQDIRP